MAMDGQVSALRGPVWCVNQSETQHRSGGLKGDLLINFEKYAREEGAYESFLWWGGAHG